MYCRIASWRQSTEKTEQSLKIAGQSLLKLLPLRVAVLGLVGLFQEFLPAQPLTGWANRVAFWPCCWGCCYEPPTDKELMRLDSGPVIRKRDTDHLIFQISADGDTGGVTLFSVMERPD